MIDNTAIDGLFAKLDALEQSEAELTLYGEQLLKRALEDDRNGLCEECENPFEE